MVPVDLLRELRTYEDRVPSFNAGLLVCLVCLSQPMAAETAESPTKSARNSLPKNCRTALTYFKKP
jgi:hypothetical protein